MKKPDNKALWLSVVLVVALVAVLAISSYVGFGGIFCAKEGETIDIGGKRCCEGLIADLDCTNCDADPWVRRRPSLACAKEGKEFYDANRQCCEGLIKNRSETGTYGCFVGSIQTCPSNCGPECEAAGGTPYAGNGWCRCSCPGKACYSNADCADQSSSYPYYCRFPEGTCGTVPGECITNLILTGNTRCSTNDVVCGCDGQTYLNHCESERRNVSIKSPGSCVTVDQVCGNGKCEISETNSNCPQDCGLSNEVPIIGAEINQMSTAAIGSSIIIAWDNIVEPTQYDGVGIYLQSSEDRNYSDWFYTSTCNQSFGTAKKASGSCTYIVPSYLYSGTYEVRLFIGRGTFVKLATSNLFNI